jgi:PAS domain-containing protein
VLDVTERESARRRSAASEQYARGLFEHSPVSLWVEDFSLVKQMLDNVRERGISDFRVFTDVHPEFVDRCMNEIRVLDVNRHTLEMFAAPDKATLLRRIGEIFRGEMRQHFREQLLDLWHGKLFQQREVVNYALDGNALYVHLQFSVLPGYEHDWSLVQVALTDIPARKKAESYLEFLGQHDVLTKLYNRSFYVEEMNRLERRGPFPVSIIMVDLNELKATNDELGQRCPPSPRRRNPQRGHRQARPRGTDRGRRVRHAGARRRRKRGGWGRRDDREAGGAEQPVLLRHAHQPVDRRCHERAGRAPGICGETSRRADV